MLKPILKSLALAALIAAGGIGTSSAAVVVGSDGKATRPRPPQAPTHPPAPPPAPKKPRR